MHINLSTLYRYFITESAERDARYKNHLINIKFQNAKGQFYACEITGWGQVGLS